MSKVVEFKKKQCVREQASVWLVLLQEGLNQVQQGQLEKWLGADRVHQKALMDLATIWDELEVLTELTPLFDGMSPQVGDTSVDREALDTGSNDADNN